MRNGYFGLVLAGAAALLSSAAAAEEIEAQEVAEDSETQSADEWLREVPVPVETGRFVVRNPVTGRRHRITLDLRDGRWDVRVDGNRVPKALRQAVRDALPFDGILLSDVLVAVDRAQGGTVAVNILYCARNACEEKLKILRPSTDEARKTYLASADYVQFRFELDSQTVSASYKAGDDIIDFVTSGSGRFEGSPQ